MVLVSIILPTFNRAKLIDSCVNSILSQSFQDWELIIIDDYSQDDTSSVVSALSAKDPRIRFIRNEIHRGLPASRNVGIGNAKGSFVLFVEDDIMLDRFCIERLVNTFYELRRNYDNVGSVGPRLIDLEHRNYERGRSVVKIGAVTGFPYTNFDIDVGKVVEVSTLHACSLFPIYTFKGVGFFDDKLYKGPYFREETDFYYRLRKAGFKLFFQPQAVMCHTPYMGGGCRRSWIAFNYYLFRNHWLFLVKFYRLRGLFMGLFFFLYYVFFAKLFHVKI